MQGHVQDFGNVGCSPHWAKNLHNRTLKRQFISERDSPNTLDIFYGLLASKDLCGNFHFIL